MQITILLIQQIAAMVLMALCGVGMAKARVLDEEKVKSVSAVALYLASPCTMISAYQTEYTTERFEALLVSFAAAAILLFGNAVITSILSRGKKKITPGEHACALYNNSGNLIIPLVDGTLGAGYVFYTTSYMFLQTMMMWTHGLILVGNAKKISLRKILRTPSIIGAVIGIMLFVLRVTLPAPVGKAVSGIGAMLAPLAMISVGVMLAETEFRSVFKSRRLYITAALRLLVLPLFSMGILLVIGHFWKSGLAHSVLTVSFLCSVGPVSTTITQLASMHDHPEKGYISSITAITTVLSAFTMPVMMLVFQTLL